MSINMVAFKDFVVSRHNPDLRKNDYVTMVWGDGEITETKGGELFGQRSNHRVADPILGMPEHWLTYFPFVVGKNSYAIVTEEAAWEIRALIIDRFCAMLQAQKKLRL